MVVIGRWKIGDRFSRWMDKCRGKERERERERERENEIFSYLSSFSHLIPTMIFFVKNRYITRSLMKNEFVTETLSKIIFA